MKQTLTELKGETDSSTMKIDRMSRQKISKETEDSNKTVNQEDLTDIKH